MAFPVVTDHFTVRIDDHYSVEQSHPGAFVHRDGDHDSKICREPTEMRHRRVTVQWMSQFIEAAFLHGAKVGCLEELRQEHDLRSAPSGLPHEPLCFRYVLVP